MLEMKKRWCPFLKKRSWKKKKERRRRPGYVGPMILIPKGSPRKTVDIPIIFQSVVHMWHQKFPQAKPYVDYLCFFHMSQLRHQFSHSADYRSQMWHQLSHSSLFRLLPALCSRSLAKGRVVKRRGRSPKRRSRPSSEVSNHRRWGFWWGSATSANHLSMTAVGFDFTGVQWQVTSICQWLHSQQVC